MVTHLSCHNCLSQVEIEAEVHHVRFCPFCGSGEIYAHEPLLDYEEAMFRKIVDPLLYDKDFDYTEKTEIIEELAEELRHFAFHRKHGALIQVLMELEER